MLMPKKIKKNDTIGIISPCGRIYENMKDNYLQIQKKFNQLGIKVVFSKHCFNVDKYGISGGESEERASDLNSMFSNPEISAIYCSRGGHVSNQILPLIDYENIKNNPKMFLGMSDIDILHLAINKKLD